MNNENNEKKLLPFRSKILLIFLLCAAPIVLSRLMFHYGLFPQKGINQGTLISPPVPLANLQLIKINADGSLSSNKKAVTKFPRKWQLIYLSPKKCSHLCQENLFKMRQIRLVMGKNAHRVIRVYIQWKLDKNAVKEVLRLYPKTTNYLIAPSQLKQLATKMKIPLDKLQHGLLVLSDPQGNLILHYKSHVHSDAVFNDLKHLLRYSHIG